MHPHLYQLDQVNDGIHQNHRDALRAEQARMILGGPSHGLAAVALSLRSSIHTIVAAVGARVRHQPAIPPEPNVYPASVAEPVDVTAMS